MVSNKIVRKVSPARKRDFILGSLLTFPCGLKLWMRRLLLAEKELLLNCNKRYSTQKHRSAVEISDRDYFGGCQVSRSVEETSR